MKKRIFSLLVVLCIAMLSLVACGTKEEQPDDTQKEDTKNDDKKDDTKTDDKTGKFYIGGIGPITGGAAVYGQNVMNAAQIAVDEINAAGGINGYMIEYRFEDDVHDPEMAVNAYNTLKDWKMQILMGTVTSNPGNAVKEETYADNMFMLTPSGSAPDVIQYDNAFAVCFADPNQGKASAIYIADNNLATKVAVIYNSSDVYSTGIYETFAEEAKNQNLEVTAEAFTDDSNSDFNVQLQKAKDNGAELVFLPIYYEEATLILTQAAAMNYKPLFFGCDGLDGILGVENFDTTLAEGVMLLTPFAADAKDAKTQKFVADYKAKHDDVVPNQFAADAYDAIYIIKAAIEKSGVTPDMSVSDICNGLKDAMTKLQVDGLTGAGMTWEATGEVNKAPIAVVIKDGQYVSY